jgi:hypothetical protein
MEKHTMSTYMVYLCFLQAFHLGYPYLGLQLL